MKNFFAVLSVVIVTISRVQADVAAYGQCGGLNYTGETTCVSGYTCVYSNDYYSQCVPGTAAATTTKTSSTKTSSTKTSSTKTSSTKTSSTKTSSTKTSTSSTKTTSTSVPASTATGTTGLEGYAAKGGTTGGAGGTTTRVSTLAALQAAVLGDSPKIVILTASLSGADLVKPGSNTSLYAASGVSLTGIGIRIINVSNVIVRNFKISKVLAGTGDAIGVQASSKVWVDHNELSSDRDHDKDYYDGLLDITHGCTYVTASWNYFHDHWKSMLIGHSDSNGSEDTALTVTVHHNYWQNLNSRGPSFRFGTGHVYSNYYENMNDGINTRDEAQLLVQNNVWSGTCSEALYSTDSGYAVATGNDFGTCSSGNTALVGTLTSAPYSYTLTATASVQSVVVAGAGAKLSF